MAFTPLLHSAPTWHWWLSMNASEQGSWVAGIGALLATITAIAIASRDSVRRRREHQARGRLVAAYLYTPFANVYVLMGLLEKHVRPYSAVMAGDASLRVEDHARMLRTICDSMPPFLQTFNLAEAAYLPAKIGETLAPTVMEIEFILRSVKASLNRYFAATGLETDTPDEERFAAANSLVNTGDLAARTVGNLKTFIDYCVREFKVPMEVKQL